MPNFNPATLVMALPEVLSTRFDVAASITAANVNHLLLGAAEMLEWYGITPTDGEARVTPIAFPGNTTEFGEGVTVRVAAETLGRFDVPTIIIPTTIGPLMGVAARMLALYGVVPIGAAERSLRTAVSLR